MSVLEGTPVLGVGGQTAPGILGKSPGEITNPLGRCPAPQQVRMGWLRHPLEGAPSFPPLRKHWPRVVVVLPLSCVFLPLLWPKAIPAFPSLLLQNPVPQRIPCHLKSYLVLFIIWSLFFH